MKKIIFSVALVFTTFMLFGQNQTELNSQSLHDYKSADLQLNKMYKKILIMYAADKSFIKNLKIAQRLWIKSRDADLKMKYPEDNSYGTAQSMCEIYYLMELTLARISILQPWIDGHEQGDVCGGTVRVRE